jgi:amino-acid N-acetyltransferase
MPKLYVEEYTRAYAGKSVVIACREGILRDYFKETVADIKFLNRQGIQTRLFHNISNRFANQKHFKALASRMPDTGIVRVPSETDFYEYVLDYHDQVYKLIFLERKYLIDQQGYKINSLTTQGARETLTAFGDLIANANYKTVLERICRKIEAGKLDRVHILPAGRNTIRQELFSVEGFGTLIANNFTEVFGPVSTDEEVKLVAGILGISKREGFLKPRTRKYIQENRHHFYVTKIDNIIVGCVESKYIDPETVELGALAISTKFRNQRVGVFTINAFIEEMTKQGYQKFISLTNNPHLQRLYFNLGFEKESLPRYRSRQEQSPGVDMFIKQMDT